ncbi:unnamed protein product [Notodromas monacha]|uniref:MABP1/WDR62 second WD40 domain-containing protein n=1 Tax=Notodromas monacha TaxID=399045 RepID=A0A7R9BGV3_9CRUS|nr:unnamed protein product [Notodromas monacha]CAG0914145.1 unnamed protein product [Notodromas monacha]
MELQRHAPKIVKLERVLGLTSSSNTAIAQDPNTGSLAYAAGCVIVVFSPLKPPPMPSNGATPSKNRQWKYLQSNSRKTITCLAFSKDGMFLASGECGHNPCVRVWDVALRVEHAVFMGHKFGINCVAFSPAQKYLVSVGAQHDQIVNVWDWKHKAKVASNRVSTKVKAVDFSENGCYFVTVGNRHVKFWYLDYSRGNKKIKDPVPLTGRSAILGEQGNNYFVDVCCGVGDAGDSTFAVTKSGLLCEFNNRRLLDRWVELRTKCAHGLSVGSSSVFIGCDDGIVRCFDPSTLKFRMTLPRPHYLGVDVSKGLSVNHMATQPSDAVYPSCVGVKYDQVHERVSCIYNDHSLYVWDVTNQHQVGKSHSFLFHSGCIWGIEGYPTVGDGVKALLPFGTFFTCSSDDTIRIWNLNPKMPTNTLYKRNIYSNELLKVLYVDKAMTHLCDKNQHIFGSPGKAGGEDSVFDSSNGVRCLKISYDGKHLASGDRSGIIRVHEMQFMDEVVRIEAHEAEVLALEYSRPESPAAKETKQRSFLASASRDRLIHVFEVHKEYDAAQTLSDHSASITSVRFVQPVEGGLRLLSCGADRSVIFREADEPVTGKPVEFSRYHIVTGKNTLYDMEVDMSGQHLLTACQDRCVRVYSLPTGKHIRTFKGSQAEEGTLIKIVLDPSGMYLATSSTDKTLCIYDYCTGDVMAVMTGHAEIVTGLLFSADCKHLISVSGDGCIFVWRLSSDMTRAMISRLKQQPARRTTSHRIPLAPTENVLESLQNSKNGFMKEDDSTQYKFNIGQLPSWAKKQIETMNAKSLRSARSDLNVNGNANVRGSEFPKGRWAQRIDNSSSQSLTVRSHHFSDTSIPFPVAPGPHDSESSKDSSSLESAGNPFEAKEKDGCDSPYLNRYGTYESYIKDLEICEVPRNPFRRANEDSKRHFTDDSSVNSFPLEGGETEHEGDIDEDFSDTEESGEELRRDEPTLYIPHNLESNLTYTVNEMDEEELRKSRRKRHARRQSDIQNLYSTSVSGSQESDLDTDFVERMDKLREDQLHSTTPSTPTADPSERNIHGLSVSTESLDQLKQREVYMLRNYDSLSEQRTAQFTPRGSMDSGKTMSSKFYSTQYARGDIEVNGDYHISTSRKSSIKNADIIEQVLEPQRRGSLKRQELIKQIEESKRKLASLGCTSLRGSRSISDLSRVPDSDVESSGAPSLQAPLGSSALSISPGKKFLGSILPQYIQSLRKKATLLPGLSKLRRGSSDGNLLNRTSGNCLSVIANGWPDRAKEAPEPVIQTVVSMPDLLRADIGSIVDVAQIPDRGAKKRLRWHRLSCPETIPENIEPDPRRFTAQDPAGDLDLFPERLQPSTPEVPVQKLSYFLENKPKPLTIPVVVGSSESVDDGYVSPEAPLRTPGFPGWPSSPGLLSERLKRNRQRCISGAGKNAEPNSSERTASSAMSSDSCYFSSSPSPHSFPVHANRALRKLVARNGLLPDLLPPKGAVRPHVLNYCVSGMRDSGALRRACSLSDLTNPWIPPRRILPSPPSQGKSHRSSSRGAVEEQGPLQRAPSMGTLQSGSGNFMRSTLSSTQKTRGGSQNAGVNEPRRRSKSQVMSLSQSIGDLRNRRVLDDDSSSEENLGAGKPAQVLQSRRNNIGGSELNLALRDSHDSRLSAGTSARSVRSSAPDVRKLSNVRRKGTPVTRQICDKAMSDLRCVTHNVVQLFKKIEGDPACAENEKRVMLHNLGQAAFGVCEELNQIVAKADVGTAALFPSPIASGPALNPANNLAGLTMPMGNPVMVQFMQQFVSMMQQQPVAGMEQFPATFPDKNRNDGPS